MLQVPTALDAILDNNRGTLEQAPKIYGVVPAIVKAVSDPKQKRHMQGMVQVFFPWLQTEADKAKIMPWARLLMPTAGKEVGFSAQPQIGDEVCVGFEHGDIHFPYVLGSLWNGKDKIPAPKTDGDKSDCKGHHDGAPTHKTPDLTPNSINGDGGKNKIYFWRSRTGNLIALDDDQGTVRINDRTGNSCISLEKDQIKVLQRSKDLMVFASKMIRLDCEDFQVHASKTITMQAGTDVTFQAGSNINVEAGAKLNASAKSGVYYSSKADMTVSASTSVSITGGSEVSVLAKSAAVKIQAGTEIGLTGTTAVNIKAGTKVGVTGAAGVGINSAAEITIKAGGNINCMANCINLN